MIFISCEKNEIIQEENYTTLRENVGAIKASVVEGRLVFKDIADFNQSIRFLENSNEIAKKEAFRNLYFQGFVPAYPHFIGKSEEEIAQYIIRKKKYIPRKYKKQPLELSDVLITSDILSSLLNIKREIVIGETLYQYTFSGLLITNFKNSEGLREYVLNHDLYNIVPDPKVLKPGLSYTDDEDIKLYVNPDVNNPDNGGPCGGEIPAYLDFQYPESNNPINTILGSNYPCGSIFASPNEGNDDFNSTESLVAYINQIEPCNVEDQWTPFGVRKKCTEYFSSGKRRTVTLYSNENWYIYEAVRVKAKHQRHHDVFGIANWWAAKKTDEVALIINDATFVINRPSFDVPYPQFNVNPNDDNIPMMYFMGGNQIKLNGGNTYQIPVTNFPQTPFDEDIIVEAFNDNISFNSNMDITIETVKEIFWTQAYDHIKKIFQRLDKSDPKKMTMIFGTPSCVILYYCDLTKREKNVRKVKDVLAYDWGVQVSFTINLTANNTIVTDYGQINNDDGLSISSFSVEPGDLLDFDAISLDFSGVSRVGEEWRGSKLIYNAL